MDITTQAYNACPKLTANSTLNISTVQFRPNPTCKTSAATFDSSAGLDATCLVNNLQNRLASALATLDTQTQKGFGIDTAANGISDVTDIKAQLTRQTEDVCGAKSTTNVVGIKDTVVTSCDWHFVQNATEKSACVTNALQKIANEVSVKQLTQSRGMTVKDLFLGDGSMFAILLRLLFILCVVGLFYYIYRQTCNSIISDSPGYKLGRPIQVTYSLKND